MIISIAGLNAIVIERYVYMYNVSLCFVGVYPQTDPLSNIVLDDCRLKTNISSLEASANFTQRQQDVATFNMVSDAYRVSINLTSTPIFRYIQYTSHFGSLVSSRFYKVSEMTQLHSASILNSLIFNSLDP